MFCTSAFAGVYDARRGEMFAVLDSLKLEPRWGDPIKSKLNEYFDFRERILAQGLQIIQETSTSNQQQADKWRELFSKAGPDGIKILYGALQDAMPSAALNFITGNTNIEADFYAKLANMPAGKIRDRIMVYRETFDKESRSLSDKWREVNSQNESIDSQARSAQRDLFELYKQTSEYVAQAENLTEKRINAIIDAALKLSPLPLPDGLDDVITETLKMLEGMETRTEAYASRLRDICANEDRLVMVFGNTRKDVADFLKTMNLSLLDNEMKEALVGIDQTGRATLTNGQRADANRYYELISVILKAHFETFGRDFEHFVSDFDHIFFNALGDKTIETILKIDEWRSWSDGVRGIALEDALKRMQDHASRNYSADLNLINDPAQKELIQKWLRQNMDALTGKVGEVQGITLSDRIRLVIYMNLPSSARAKLLDRLKER